MFWALWFAYFSFVWVIMALCLRKLCLRGWDLFVCVNTSDWIEWFTLIY